MRAQAKAADDKEKELERQKRELNPYWKDGGAGLPPTQVSGTRPRGVWLALPAPQRRCRSQLYCSSLLPQAEQGGAASSRPASSKGWRAAALERARCVLLLYRARRQMGKLEEGETLCFLCALVASGSLCLNPLPLADLEAPAPVASGSAKAAPCRTTSSSGGLSPHGMLCHSGASRVRPLTVPCPSHMLPRQDVFGGRKRGAARRRGQHRHDPPQRRGIRVVQPVSARPPREVTADVVYDLIFRSGPTRTSQATECNQHADLAASHAPGARGAPAAAIPLADGG